VDGLSPSSLIPADLYYWFSVGEGILPLHHLIAQNTPNKKFETQIVNHRN
jgi:hypothetical protein